MNSTKKAFFASMLGNALEFYDYTVYGFFVMAIPTAAIGLLPTYQQIDIIAPILLKYL